MQINLINKLSIKLDGFQTLQFLWCRNIRSHNTMSQHKTLNTNKIFKNWCPNTQHNDNLPKDTRHNITQGVTTLNITAPSIKTNINENQHNNNEHEDSQNNAMTNSIMAFSKKHRDLSRHML